MTQIGQRGREGLWDKEKHRNCVCEGNGRGGRGGRADVVTICSRSQITTIIT